ncbi:hypothetical protein [Ferruginibacter sp.]
MMKHIIYILLLFFLVSCGDDVIREPHSLAYDSTSFNALANKIIKQNSIFEMDDLKRHYKKINKVNVRYSNGNDAGDTACADLYTVIDSLKIDKALVFDLKRDLEKTTLREFYKSNDSILFRVDGLLGTSWGFFYSKRPLNNTTSFTFTDFLIENIERVNAHWKKVAIHP